jgi:tetratricopeptide (TPR) repeat protein
MKLKIALYTVGSFFFVAVFSVATASEGGCEADNTTPMYGYDRNHKENSCDVAFIKEVTTGNRPRADASNEVAYIGWQALRSGDSDKAIKRFNQAWLLNRKNAGALWGFGVWERNHEHFDQSEKFLKEALKYEKDNPELYVDLGRTVGSRASGLKNKKLFNEAQGYFNKAKSLRKDYVEAFFQAAVYDRPTNNPRMNKNLENL